jgi:Ni,Fe-hydrogenase III small subunit/formate hydrogenlyase subunit 6/NADH:ubiquinone oxidoreductase subunit I
MGLWMELPAGLWMKLLLLKHLEVTMFKTIEKIIKYPRLTQDYPQKTMDSRLFIGKPEIDNRKCTGCGECLKRCPSGAIVRCADSVNKDAGPRLKENGSGTEDISDGVKTALSTDIGINYDECVFCALCEDVCPAGAVQMTNKFELAEKDRNLLRSSTLVIREGDVPDITEEDLNNRLTKKIRKLFGRSLQIREVDAGSCNGCDYEINALNNPFNDIERLGIHFVASPRHADMLLVTGTATRNMEQALLKTYEATPEPKLVVAVGACACSGGIFRDSYAANRGIDTLVPVDAYIPGCPPRPQAIMYGILKVLDRVK